jgi:hypothetical protein
VKNFTIGSDNTTTWPVTTKRRNPDSEPAVILARLDKLDPKTSAPKKSAVVDEFLQNEHLAMLEEKVDKSRKEAWRQLEDDELAR